MKALFSICVGVLFALSIALPCVNAQDTSSKVINGGVLNGKAVSLPKPEYPESVRKAGIEGAVGVNVIIDEAGTVVYAASELNDQRVRRAEDGTILEPVPVDASLRAVAETAARQAKFSPTSIGELQVQVRGKIIYNFVARDTTQADRVNTVSGGVLNGKATSLPIPAYPATAKAVKAQGSVNVQVTLDEEGKVTEATAISGHPLLRSASEAAAREAKFAPTLLSGSPIRVKGVLVYNFSLPKSEDQ